MDEAYSHFSRSFICQFISSPTHTPERSDYYGGPPGMMAYMHEAAANGSAASQYAMACHYEIGAGVPLDRARARALCWADNPIRRRLQCASWTSE